MSDSARMKVALVGAAGLLGREVKEQLANAGVPGTDVALFDLEDEVGLLTEYGDEARVLADTNAEALGAHGLVIFCGSSDVACRFAPAVLEAGGTVIDCTGGVPASTLWGSQTTLPATSSVIAVPHAGTTILAALARATSLAGAVVTMMMPASAHSDAGPERLARESVALLSLQAGDEEAAVERRSAFDQWPDDAVAARIVAELQRTGVAVPHLSALRSPVFHGLSASVWLPHASVPQLLGGLGQAAIGVAATDDATPVDSPARVAGEAGVHVAGVREDAAGGVWLWAVIDNHLAMAGAVVEIVALYRADESATRN